MLSYEGTGKNIEKAIEDALFVLKAPREDVDIKILEEGGLFKKAKVLVTISEDCKEKYEKKTIEKISEEDLVLDVKDLLSGKEENPKSVQEDGMEECEDIEIKSDYEIQSLNFLSALLAKLKIKASINYSVEDNKTASVVLSGDKASDVIGYRGECLNSIQYLMNVIESKTEAKLRIVLDTENYREKREETLINLANRMARKVAKTKHAVKLEPMNANERRIIHTALQNDTYVETISKGNEPNRFLTIIPRKKD